MNADLLKQAVEWEKQRAIALQKAAYNQQNDLARLQQLQNQSAYNQQLSALGQGLQGYYGTPATQMVSYATMQAMHTGCAPRHTFPVYYGLQDITQARPGQPVRIEDEQNQPVKRDHTCHTACGCREETRKAEAITHKTFTETHPPLSLKTSPCFGHLRYRFDSPFKPLSDWWVRFILKHRRLVA